MNGSEHIFRTAVCECPECGEVLSEVRNAMDCRRPSPGAVAVCGYCNAILKFNSDIRLEALLQAEINILPAESLRNLMILLNVCIDVRNSMRQSLN